MRSGEGIHQYDAACSAAEPLRTFSAVPCPQHAISAPDRRPAVDSQQQTREI